MKKTKTKLSLLACALLTSSNLYGIAPIDYVKNMQVGIGNSAGEQFTRTNSSYTTQSNGVAVPVNNAHYYFNENSFFTILYDDTNNLGNAMVGRTLYALYINTPYCIAYDTTAIEIDSTNTAEALNYFKNNVEIKDNSALLDFEYHNIIYSSSEDTAISMQAIQAQTVENTIASDNKNAGNAAVVLQNIIDNSANNPKMDGVINALNKLGSNKQVADAVDSTTPQTTTSSFTASNQISNNVANIVSQRQTITLNGGGLNSGDEMFGNKNVWAKAYGSMGSQDDKNGVNGFDIDSYGFGVGIDGEYSDNNQIGVGFFYTNAEVDVNNVSQTSDIDVYSLIVYGSNPVIDNKTNLMYQVGYSWQKTDSQRDIAFMNTKASADYTSKIASVDLKLLRDYRINDDLLVQPLISTTYRHFSSPSYSESGAGALNLDVNKFSSSELILGVGALAYYKLDDSSKLFANVNVGYDLKDDNNTVSSSYQGASGLSFQTDGIDNGRWNYDLGVGYEKNISELSNLSFSYNFQGEGSEYKNHVLSAKYTFKF